MLTNQVCPSKTKHKLEKAINDHRSLEDTSLTLCLPVTAGEGSTFDL